MVARFDVTVTPTFDERRFTAESDGGPVPALAWLPTRGGAAPVVLLGHGGSGSKRSPRNERLGQWFAGNGLAALAIDGPYHGDRAHGVGPDVENHYQQIVVGRGVERVSADMVQDWVAALDTLAATGRADPDRVGYLGLSMGTRFGIPLAAHLGERLRCAVFGKFGLTQGGGLHEGLHSPDSIRMHASRIRVPVLMHVQWDDDLFPRDGGLALFDAFGSTDKTLVARPGPHGGSHPDDERTWRDFVAGHLSRVP